MSSEPLALGASAPPSPGLRKFVAPEIVAGLGARLLAAQYAQNFGAHKVLLVSDPGVIAAGWASEIEDELRGSGLEVVLFFELTPDPKAHEVMAGAELYEHQGCDVIVAIGGGSVLDCAKGIGIVAINHRPIIELEGVDRVPRPPPPMVFVPTTGGSAADVSQFAIIEDEKTLSKLAIVSKSIVPDVSLIDPLPLTSMPRELSIHTGIDVLTHALEAYVSNAHSELTDLLALHAARLLVGHLAESIADPANVDKRRPIMQACLEAGLAFSNASLGAVHAMSHSLGGLLGIPHGLCNALVLPEVVDFNFPAARERYRQIASAFGIGAGGMSDDEVRLALVGFLKRFVQSLGLTRRLADLGLQRSQVPELSRKAARDPCMVTNPRWPTLEELEELYGRAF